VKTIFYTLAGRKGLRALPPPVQAEIKAKLARYAESGAGDLTKLQGMAGARLRVRDYRVIFVETDKTIEVRAVGHRRDIYR
jgi:mRNA interferase RelE/StbE